MINKKKISISDQIIIIVVVSASFVGVGYLLSQIRQHEAKSDVASEKKQVEQEQKVLIVELLAPTGKALRTWTTNKTSYYHSPYLSFTDKETGNNVMISGTIVVTTVNGTP